MRWQLAVVGMVAACGGGELEHYPVVPGGGGGGGGGLFVDAMSDVDASTIITGRVCKITDPRSPTTGCASTGVEGLTVTIGEVGGPAGPTATTAADGMFTIMRPTSGTNHMWQVSGTGVKSSATEYVLNEVTIPAVDAVVYETMLTNVTETEDLTRGGLIARLRRAGTPVSGAVVLANPIADSGEYGDGAAADAWVAGSTTGPLGFIWMPRVAPGTVDLLVDKVDEDVNITIIADHVTFAFENI